MSSSASVSHLIRHRRLWVVLVVMASIAFVVSVGVWAFAAMDAEHRNAIAPIEWRGSPDSLSSGIDIRLDKDGRAEVIGLPRGE